MYKTLELKEFHDVVGAGYLRALEALVFLSVKYAFSHFLKKRCQEKWENAYLTLKNTRASRALRRALDPGRCMLASLALWHCAPSVNLRKKLLGPPWPNPGSAAGGLVTLTVCSHWLRPEKTVRSEKPSEKLGSLVTYICGTVHTVPRLRWIMRMRARAKKS